MSDGAENDAYLDLVEAEVGRAVAAHGVQRAVLELTEVRNTLSSIRTTTSATGKRNAYSTAISAIDARLVGLRTELEGLR